MLIYIRHGETNLNGPAGSSEERLRGWLPADLTPKGRKQAQAAADQLQGLQPATFHTSDLPRAMETAGILSSGVGGMQPTPTFALRDWNTGQLAGQKFPDVKDQLFHYMDHPDEVVPGGESLNTYLQRFIPFVKGLAQDSQPHLVVGHARGTQVIHGLAAGNGDWIHPGPLKDKPVIEPGERMIVTPDWTTIPSHLKQQEIDNA